MEIIDKRIKTSEIRLKDLKLGQPFFKDELFYIRGPRSMTYPNTIALTNLRNGSHQQWNEDCFVIPINAHVEIKD